MPCLHEHCRARTINPNHRKIKEKKMTWHKICIDFNDISFQNMFI